MRRREFLGTGLAGSLSQPARGKLHAGAAATNINPHLGGSLAGSFTDIRSREIHDDLRAKCLVLDNGSARLALIALDLCVVPAGLVSRVKQAMASGFSIPAAHALLCCTHTHSGPTTMPLFQSRPDPGYLEFLERRILDAVRLSVARLQPARLGFGFGREDRLVFNRRYEMKPGTIPPNPFGGIDRVRTNPGIANPGVVRPAGPVDPTVGILSVQSRDGRPLAVAGNYSLHYVGGVGGGHISADYFSWWAAEMAARCGAGEGPGDPPFLAMLTNGAQGDINNVDVLGGNPERLSPYQQIGTVARKLADESFRVLRETPHREDVQLGASEEWLELGVRLPSPGDVRVAKQLLASAPPQPQHTAAPLVYARETIDLAESFPQTERVPVQALRIGDAGLAAFAGEPFVELGLTLRRESPLRELFVIGLSNGQVGYVPTAAAHEQGGYETWRAKTSYLEKQAADKIVSAMQRRLSALAK